MLKLTETKSQQSRVTLLHHVLEVTSGNLRMGHPLLLPELTLALGLLIILETELQHCPSPAGLTYPHPIHIGTGPLLSPTSGKQNCYKITGPWQDFRGPKGSKSWWRFYPCLGRVISTGSVGSPGSYWAPCVTGSREKPPRPPTAAAGLGAALSSCRVGAPASLMP